MVQTFVNSFFFILPVMGLFVTIEAQDLNPLVDRPEGFGAIARGGEGGRTIAVTSLADAGPGSLREALSVQGPRTIKFSVEGTIELQKPIRVSHGRVTVDGSTAPGNGITLLNHGIFFIGDCDDIIVRHLRIRVTTGGSEGDCLTFWGTKGGIVERVLVDHCSLMWATDEVLNTWGDVRDFTCQWTIIAEGRNPHGKAWLSGTGSNRISIHHCLLAHNSDRNPKVEGGIYDIVNNVIYNWSNNNGSKIESGARVNLINNYYIAGPRSAATKGCVFPDHPDQETKVYVAGNISPLTPHGTENPWLNVTGYETVGGKLVERHPAPEIFRIQKPFTTAAVTTQSAKDAYEPVLSHAGAKVRDEDDLRVIEEVKSRKGSAKLDGN